MKKIAFYILTLIIIFTSAHYVGNFIMNSFEGDVKANIISILVGLVMGGVVILVLIGFYFIWDTPSPKK